MSEQVSFNAQHLATPGGPDQDTPSPGTSETRQYYRPEKRFVCDWEGCTHPPFTCPHNVKQHIREVHTGERPSSCHICEADGKIKAFARPATLYRHIREVHKIECNGKKGRSATKDVGPSATPMPVRPTSKGNRASRPVTSYPSPQTPSPALSNMTVEMFPRDSFDTPATMAMADEWVAETGQAFPLGMFPALSQPTVFPQGPNRVRCEHCFGRPLVEDIQAHIAILHSTPAAVGGPWPLVQDMSVEEFMASLEQTTRQLEDCRPAAVQQPTPQHSPAPFAMDIATTASADNAEDFTTTAGADNAEDFALELDALIGDPGLLGGYGGVEEDMDFKWELSGLQ